MRHDCALHGAMLALPLATIALLAQNQPPVNERATFEVASIKPNTTGGFRMNVEFQPGGRMVVANAPVTMLLVQAFLIPSSRTVGAPAWTRTSRFDIEAKASGDPPTERMRQMARSLLVDRFKLIAHVERREQDGYALAFATPDRTLGPQIRKASAECAAREAAPGCDTRAGSGTLTSGAITMESLAMSLSLALDRRVIDETGLAGDYALTLTYAPERQLVPAPPTNRRADDDRVSILTAIQDQLGLKLERRRTSVEFLVVDHIEAPSEN